MSHVRRPSLLPARSLLQKRDIFKQQRDLVDRRSIAGPLGEWARTASAHAVNLLVYNGGVVRRIGIYIYNLVRVGG